ncbi:MAG: MaoC family dehydratase N-terminal domain-containing protein [Candidatus Pelagadaptatus aseana]|uniref:MaoC family dehydratase N-terminal domain-containing protein n=1 Tax=Candidatus Pelagadaptatus aseana TaxID=3120508 RepID=UPI0039B13CB1
MLDRSKIGHEFPSFSVDIEKGRLKFFAKAIGETNPVYTDEEAARAAGFKALPAPPTFMMSVDLDAPEFLPMLSLLEMDLGRVLHGAQDFEYIGQIYAGDTITQTSKILDMFDKKGGALEFIVLESAYTNQDGELVGKAQQTIVYRN